MRVRKTHLPSRLTPGITACGRDTQAVIMAAEPDEDYATCWRCYDDWHFADVNGEPSHMRNLFGGSMAKRDVVSAGGVVWRLRDGLEVVLCGKGDPVSWRLPKGTREDSREFVWETAMREVREETGLRPVLGPYIGVISYEFPGDDRSARYATDTTYFKDVHFYLMEVDGGSIDSHDDEFDVVEWVPFGDAVKMLTYQDEADILFDARDVLCDAKGWYDIVLPVVDRGEYDYY